MSALASVPTHPVVSFWPHRAHDTSVARIQAGQYVGRRRAGGTAALVPIDPRLECVELSAERSVELGTAMPHAGDEVHGQQVPGARDSEATLDELLVGDILAGRNDRVMRALDDDDRALQVSGVIEPAQIVRH